MGVHNTINYRPDIDGIRAIAVLLVLVFHFDLFSIGKAGFVGVDIFFVISGFLITSIVKKQLDSGAFSFGSFYIKRLRRLMPALGAVLFLTMIVGALILLPADFEALTTQILATQLYFSNIYYWQHINYFGLQAESTFLLHTWSLAVEEQFYLAFPAALFIIYRYAKKFFWEVIFLALIVSFVLNVAYVADKPEATFFLMPTRAWELLAGSFIVILIEPFSGKKVIKEILGVMGIFLILCSLVFYKEDIRFPGYFALLPVSGAFFLILAGAGIPSFASRMISVKPVVYIGKISYSLYLVHWPINVFALTMLGQSYNKTWHFLMFGLSLLLASILYKFIECPFRNGGQIKSDKKFIFAYSMILIFTISIFFVSKHTDGIPSRFPENVVKMANFVNDTPPAALESCQYSGQKLKEENEFCSLGVPDQRPTWVVYGDSHAWAAKEVFDKWLKKNNQSGLFIFRHACPPILGVYLFRAKGECFDFNRKVVEFITLRESIKNVVLVSTWLQAKEGILSNSPIKKLSVDESIVIFEKQFSATLTELNKTGKRIFIWEPLPGAKGNVPKIMAQSLLSGKVPDLEFSLKEYRDTYDFFFSALKDNESKIYMSFSPSSALCEQEKCLVLISDKPVYTDNAHLAQSLSEYWVNVLDNQYHSRIHQPK